jgi:hypothetical protein
MFSANFIGDLRFGYDDTAAIKTAQIQKIILNFFIMTLYKIS